jgi:hypothetical protein
MKQSIPSSAVASEMCLAQSVDVAMIWLIL